MTEALDNLKGLLAERSVRFGEFTLASGTTSNVYIDVRQTSLSSDGAALIGECILAKLGEFGESSDISGVGGLTLGADPLVTATAIAAHHAGRTLGAIIVRKATKGHGTQRRIEAPAAEVAPGDHIVALDDVTTTGGSTIDAIEALREAGYRVEHAISVVDRETGAIDAMAEIGVTLHPLFTLVDFEVGDS